MKGGKKKMSKVLDYKTFLEQSKETKKGDNLTSYDKRKNQEYYKRYLKEQAATDTYKTQLDELDKNKNTALRDSAIATERARRYLETVAKQNGMSGSGYSQGKIVDLYSEDASRRAGIYNTHSIQSNSALEAYKKAIAEASATAEQGISEIDSEQEQYNEQKSMNDRAEVLAQLDSNQALYESGAIDFDTYSKYYTSNKHLLDSAKDSTIMGVYEKAIEDNQNDKLFTASDKNEAGTKVDWYIQGLGTGRENDDIDITIGSTSRNRSEEFDLLSGARVEDDSTIKELNKLATGNENTTPDISGKNNSGASAGQLVIYNNNMYIYTKKGWRIVKDDNRDGEVQRAINMYLADSRGEKVTENTDEAKAQRKKQAREAYIKYMQTPTNKNHSFSSK